MAKEKPGAGQSKAARAARLAANKGVKAGTVRKGAGGKYVRQWNAKTARWDIVGASKKTAAKYVSGVKKAADANPKRKSASGLTAAQSAAQKAKRDAPAPPRAPASGIKAGVTGGGVKGGYRSPNLGIQRTEEAKLAKRFGAPPTSGVRKLSKTATPKGSRVGEFAQIGSMIYVWNGQKWIASRGATKR